MRSAFFSRSLAPVLTLLLVTVGASLAAGQSGDPLGHEDGAQLVTNDPRFWHTATALADGSVLVAGGMDGRYPLSSAELYDPVRRTFQPVGPMTTARGGHTATLLPDGRVLIAGGWSDKLIRTIEVYDPAVGTFTPVGRMGEARVTHAATLLPDGRVLLVGGSGKAGRPTAGAEVFDPATGQSRSVGSMRHRRMLPTLIGLEGGRVAVLAGLDRSGVQQRIEVYRPDRRRFGRGASIPEEAVGGAVARLSDGRILSLGSGKAALVGPSARRVELLEVEPRAAYDSTATPLDDGRVVVMSSDGGAPRVDIFDPVSRSLIDAGSLTLSRSGLTATRLTDGTILVVGGTACETVLDAAELWDPASMTVLAAGSEKDCDPSVKATPEPLPPLGRVTQGGRIEMPGSGFAITVPEDWTVELAEPDTDVFAAAPGTAWEALRATAPDRSMACSVAIGISPVSLRDAGGTGSAGDTVPRWHPTKRGVLMVPSPLVEEGETTHSSMAPRERLHREDPALDHDVMYSVHCVGDTAAVFEQVADSLEFLPAP